MDAHARRNLGAHYTSEENILKLIEPLFLDELWEEFGRIKGNRNRLLEFHQRLRRMNFLDPACGCGNFLVIAYRELRKLELEIMRAVRAMADTRSRHLFDSNLHQQVSIDVDQFYGIEIEEFPAQIAQVALWLADHQMNTRISEEFGMYFARIPLQSTPHITCGNALRIDWNDVLPAERCSYVLGNPPFVGSKFLNEAQRADVRTVAAALPSVGTLDFVSAWYVVAAKYLRGTQNRAAFVSTNSITQGEQVASLWGWLLAQGLRIGFAHRTFQWSNEGPGMAAVHCVIIGFSYLEPLRRSIFEYDDIRGEPHLVTARNINPYLIDAPDILVAGRATPLSEAPPMVNGSIPADGGNLILSPADRDALLAAQPAAAPWLRPYIGAEGLIHNELRYCLWLKEASPDALRRIPEIMQRVAAVSTFRSASAKRATRDKAATPTRFTEDRQPEGGGYLAVPRTSSEHRRYLPLAFLPAEVVAANDLQIVPEATLYHFAVLSSAMHMAWVRVTAGRLESRIRYSAKFTYNTFPWPGPPIDAQRAKIEAAAQGVIDARAAFSGASLADLYDPLTMPPALLKAHRALDAAVDAAYGRKGFKSDAERVAFLFDLYQKYTSLLPASQSGPRRGAWAHRG